MIARVVARLAETESGRLKSSGLSLLDLQKLAIERGHKAEGFRLHIDQLSRIERPVIVFIKPFGYAHFAVLRGIRGDRVHLADPSLGIDLVMGAVREAMVALTTRERLPDAYPEEFTFHVLLGLGLPRAAARRSGTSPVRRHCQAIRGENP